MTIPLTATERTANSLVPGPNGFQALTTNVPEVSAEQSVLITNLQTAVAALDTRVGEVETDGALNTRITDIENDVQTLQLAGYDDTSILNAQSQLNTRVQAIETDYARKTSVDQFITARPLMRTVYLYDTLINLNADNVHAANTYALVIDGDQRLVSNGTDDWITTVVDIISLASNNSVFIRGNVDAATGATYLRLNSGKGATYEVIGDEIV